MIPTASQEAERDFRERGLTGREADAARSALSGMTAAAAAREMGVSSSTVGNFRQRAYRKLGVTSARELAAQYGRQREEGRAAGDSRAALLARGLSQTQSDVLSLVAEGLSTDEVAERLSVAPGTVSSARATGYRMLGVHSREELAALLEREAAAPRRRRAARLAAACLAAVMVVAAAVTVTSYLGSQPPAVVETEFGEVPNVVGMDPQSAWEVLVAEDYFPVIQESRSTESPGTVVDVDVQALPENMGISMPLDPSGTVHAELNETPWKAEAILSVSGLRKIPNITLNCSERDARKLLEDAGFSNVEVAYQGDVDPSDNRVILARPTSGSWASPNEPVELTVTSDVTVPDVLGMTPLDASSELVLAGFSPDPYITEWSYSTSDKGTPVAIATDPMCGETARVGDTVRIIFDRPLEE
ncbi:PASTA domain-containing protein [Olsenella sp. SW781]|uniref:LuxR C-terminal-related transcriptional regulator n=1 Tax=Olsenella sp. SW781 TaxID=2530046 RepID=UPI00143B420E|nr:LuxR C-terminal-related transcriptional regulator [Olsenella sp. SW781]NJE80735.1 PASTA domain-containing protein [Olsenella sp. SW781]